MALAVELDACSRFSAFAVDTVDHAVDVPHIHDLVHHRYQGDQATNNHGGITGLLFKVAQYQVFAELNDVI